MRHLTLLAAMLAVTAPVLAQETKVWTDAPVPTQSILDVVAPAARAGRSTGPDNASPFSGLPSGAVATGGETSSNTTPRDVSTPSVSR